MGWCGFSPRRSDRFVIDSNQNLQSCGGDEFGLQRRLGHGFDARPIRYFFLPNRPYDARHFVGQRHSRLIVTDAVLELQSPIPQMVRITLPFSRDEHGTSSVNQHGAQVNIAKFTDAAQTAFQAAGIFTRGQTQISGKVSAGAKASHVAHETDQCSCRQQTHTRYRA